MPIADTVNLPQVWYPISFITFSFDLPLYFFCWNYRAGLSAGLDLKLSYHIAGHDCLFCARFGREASKGSVGEEGDDSNSVDRLAWCKLVSKWRALLPRFALRCNPNWVVSICYGVTSTLVRHHAIRYGFWNTASLWMLRPITSPQNKLFDS